MSNITFSQFVQSVGLEGKIPFFIDFQIKPVSTSEATSTIAGMTFARIGSLTMKEAFIYEQLERVAGLTDARERLTQVVLAMAEELGRATSNSNLVECLGFVYNTPEEVQNHPNFSIYLDQTEALRAEVKELSETLSNPFVAIAKATFFILSRVELGKPWGLEDTSNLTNEDLLAIIDFIEEERNPESSEDASPAGYEAPEDTSIELPKSSEGKQEA